MIDSSRITVQSDRAVQTSNFSSQSSPTSWPISAERRAEFRFKTSCAAKMRILNQSTFSSIDVTIVNASRSGIRVAIPAHVTPGSIVRVTFGKSILIGEVRNCRVEGDSFYAGLFVSVFYQCNQLDGESYEGRIGAIIRHRGAGARN